MTHDPRLARLQAMSVDQLGDEVARVLADETLIANLSAAELDFLMEKEKVWRAETARIDAEIKAGLAAWKPPICAATGRAWRH